MNILKVLKSFDIFNREAVKFFKDRIVNVILVNTEDKKLKGMNVNSNDEEININVINRPKMYNLLMCAQRRCEQKRRTEKIEKKQYAIKKS
jgi:hypothetical protein